MYEELKKSIEEFKKNWAGNLFEWTGGVDRVSGEPYYQEAEDEVIKHIITSHITLAKEKIKELEGERKKRKSYFKDSMGKIRVSKTNKGYNQALEDQITKQEQFIKELEELIK